MTKSTITKPLFAEVHCVPDDYHFTEEELDRIIAGDMFTPRQDAIMARELQERRKADSDPVYQERRYQFIGKRQLEYWADVDRSAFQYLPKSERRIIHIMSHEE